MDSQSATKEDFSGLPAEMRSAKRWMLWRLEESSDHQKKGRKIPWYVNRTKRQGQLDSPEDIAKLATFDDALKRFQTGSYSGLGFALGPDGTGNYWQGVDFDHLSEHPELESIKKMLPGYIEISPSGDGIHAIGYGRRFDTLGSNASGIEAYAAGRYFTVTGRAITRTSPTCLYTFVENTLKPMYGKRVGIDSPDETQDRERVSSMTINDLRSALLFMRSDDRELWVRMAHALKFLGDVGHRLWIEWSAMSEKFDAADAARVWDSCKPTQTHWKAVFAEAQRHGWINPAVGGDKKADGHAGSNEFLFTSVGELISKPKPVSWLIHGMIERGSLATLFGATNTGKSFVALDWAASIATGREWQGMTTQRGSVFYIAGEGHSGIGRRLKAWELHTSQSLVNAPLFVSNCPAALMDVDNAANVATAVDALAVQHGAPSLVVIDTLARNFGPGDENSNSDVGVFINNVDTKLRLRFGATVLIIHHTGWTEKDRARGASAMRAAMDSEYRLDVSDATLSISCTKAKETELVKSMNFSLKQIPLDGWIDSDGELMTSAVLVRSDEFEQRKSVVLKGANRIALESLRKSLNTDGQLPPEELREARAPLAPVAVIGEDVWRQRAYDEGISDGEQEAKKKAFSRSRKTLLDLEFICTWRDWYWLNPFKS